MEQFSKKELEFLSNFSSIEELETFTSKIDKSIEKIRAKATEIEAENPELLYGAGGALLGAGLGAGSVLLIGDEKKNKLRKALEAGALGALIGTTGGIVGGALRGNSIREKLAADKIAAGERRKTVMEMLKNNGSINFPELSHEGKAPTSEDEIVSMLKQGVTANNPGKLSDNARAILNLSEDKGAKK